MSARYTLLSVAEQIVVLPVPQFNDSQNYSGTLNLKRTMTGDTYTYVRRSRLNALKYTFWIGRQKSFELQSFLVNYSDHVMTLQNWKGELWNVLITNSPFEFTAKERYQPQGERIEITLEFEGLKVN